MKKILLIILLFALCFLCYKNYKTYPVHVTYDVIYPDTTIRYDTIFDCKAFSYQINKQNLNVYTNSYIGSNYIQINPGMNQHAWTTMPIRIISYNFK